MKKIDRVVVTNFKKHESYIGKYEGKHFILFGSNGAGKTSILDAIKRCLGQKAKLLEPVRTGADGATISTYLFDDKEKFCLEEKFSKSTGKSRLKFYRVNGSHRDELNPPLERFYERFGKPIDFTPLIDMDGNEQFEFLKNNLGFDLSMYEHNYDAVYDDRTLVGREVSALKAKLNDPASAVTEADIAEYAEEKRTDEILKRKVDITSLMEEKGRAVARDTAIKTVKEKEDELTKKIEDLESQLVTLRESKKTCEEWHITHPPIEVAPIDEKLATAKETNDKIDEELLSVENWNKSYRKVQDHISNKAELETQNKDYADKSKQLLDIENEMRQILTQLPLKTIVPDLELVYENSVVLNEKGKEVKVKKVGLMLESLPFNRSQHSYGKLLKSIIKMAAHFNANKLNFISIGDWNLLDPESQSEVLEFAKENPDLNVQFGIEKVDTSKEVITELIEV